MNSVILLSTLLGFSECVPLPSSRLRGFVRNAVEVEAILECEMEGRGRPVGESGENLDFSTV